MKSEQFVKYFFEVVRNSMSRSEKLRKEDESRRENFAKTCRYALEEIFRNSKIIEVNADNFRTFSKLYIEKLNELVANERLRHSQKVHWLSQVAADVASETLQRVFQEKIQPEVAARDSKPFAQAHAPARLASQIPLPIPAPLPAPVVPARVAPAKAAAPIAAAPPILPAFSAALKPKSTPKSSWTDTTPFQNADYEDADITADERGDFEFACNCCSYPRLVIYLRNAYKWNPRYSCIAINMVEAENKGAKELTPNQILAITKDAEKAKIAAIRCG